MYIITRKKLSTYANIIFIEVPEEFESLVEFLDLDIHGTADEIIWHKKNRANHAHVAEYLVPQIFFTSSQIFSPFKSLEFKINGLKSRWCRGDFIVYPSDKWNRVTNDAYNKLLKFWEIHPLKDMAQQKYLEIFQKKDLLDILIIHQIIT